MWFHDLTFNKWIDIISHGAGSAAQIDMRSTQLPGRLDGMADAYRHILISAELTRKYGEVYASTVMGFHEWNEVGAGSAMDNYNNQVGYQIGQYVASQPNGGYGDVLSLTREAFQQIFGGETQPNAANGFTSTINSWSQSIEGYLTSPSSITLEGGNLILSGIAVLNTGSWLGFPKVNGQEITIDISNWPDTLGNWVNNFVFDEVNSYTGDVPIDPLTGLPIDPVESFISGLELYESGFIWTATTLEELAQELQEFADFLVLDVNEFVDDTLLVGAVIAENMLDIANMLIDLGIVTFFDPLVLDMDGDGIELINVNDSGAFFDFDKDGFNEKAGWVKPDDAFLVHDKNSNGIVDDIDELFGNETISGFDELALQDSTAGGYSDGKIDSTDAVWADLRIWHDLDSDGVTDAGELITLAAAGIDEISLTRSDFNKEFAGNMITETGTWVDTLGGSHTVADVDFLLEQVNSLPQPDGSAIDLTLAAALAPWSRGYGDVYSLQHEMSTNVVLTDKVYELVNLAPEEFHLASGLVEEILYEWAGTTAVSTTSRGTEWDGRKLATFEKFTGEAFTNGFGGPDPLTGSGVFLSRAWTNLTEIFHERLIVQGPMRSIFQDAQYDFFTDELDIGAGTSDLIAQAMAIETNENMTDFWFKFIDIMIEHDRSAYAEVSEETLAALEEWDGEIISFCAGSGSCPPPSPWNKYTTEFKSDFVALIEDKLDLNLADIDGNGVIDENDRMILINNSRDISPTGGVNILSAEQYYSGPTGQLADTHDFILGGLQDDAIHGYGGNDVLYAGSGNDYIYGHEGDNYLFGGAGSDTIVSSDSSNDVIYGNDGADKIQISGASHTIDGGAGDDTIEMSNTSAALIRWGQGDGNDVITTVNGGVGSLQTLVIGDDLTTNDIRMHTYAGDLYVINDLTQEQFKIINYGEELDEVVFADGTVWDIRAGAEFRAHATDDTTTTGWIGNDTLLSGAGNDILNGHTGTDLFIHELGDGNDTLYGGGLNDHDAVQMNSVAATDLYFNRVGIDLIVTNIATDEELVLRDQYKNENFGYEFGTVNGIAVDAGITVKGSSATLGEVITGTSFADTLIGGAGNDVLNGSGGTDTYIHEAGDGSDVLNAGANNSLSIIQMNGVAAADLYFNKSGNDLLITDTLTNEQLVLDNQFYNTHQGYEFSTINGIDLTGGLTVQGTSATLGEVVYGTAFGDTLIGGAGNDILYGNGGSDSFIHDSGDGDDHLYSLTNGITSVQMNGVAAGDLFFNVSTYDLIVTDVSTGEKLVLDNQLHNTHHGYEFNTVNGIDVTAGLTVQGTSATLGEAIYGTTFADTLIGGLGNDILYGNGGADTFTHDSGDGNDHLYAGGNNSLTTVQMNGVATGDLFFNVSTYDLVVTDNATGETLHLDNQFRQISSGYEFGTVNGIDITGGLSIQGTSHLYATTNNDTLEGTSNTQYYYASSGDDDLIASEGSDLLYGQAGADTFIFEDVTTSTDTTYSTIKDFEAGELIDFSSIASIDELSDLTITESGGNSYIDDNNSSFYLVVDGNGATGLDSSDFIFV